MKKGLHIIRALWKGADCNLPPVDDACYGAPKWEDYGESPVASIYRALKNDTATPRFVELQDHVNRTLSAYFAHGRL